MGGDGGCKGLDVDMGMGVSTMYTTLWGWSRCSRPHPIRWTSFFYPGERDTMERLIAQYGTDWKCTVRTASTQSSPSLPRPLSLPLAACLSFPTLAYFCLFFISSFLLNPSPSRFLDLWNTSVRLHQVDLTQVTLLPSWLPTYITTTTTIACLMSTENVVSSF